jgi:hypothetical protein
MFTPPKEPFGHGNHADAAEPNDAQKRALSELVYAALVEIRALELDGKHDQARAVAELFHNVPKLIWTPWFSFSFLRKQVAAYHEQFAGSGHVNFAEWLAKITGDSASAAGAAAKA